MNSVQENNHEPTVNQEGAQPGFLPKTISFVLASIIFFLCAAVFGNTMDLVKETVNVSNGYSPKMVGITTGLVAGGLIFLMVTVTRSTYRFLKFKLAPKSPIVNN